MVLFLAISGAVFQNTAITKVSKVLPDASSAEISILVAGTSNSVFKSLPEATKALILPQITEAMRGVWIFYLTAASLSFVASLAIGVSL